MVTIINGREKTKKGPGETGRTLLRPTDHGAQQNEVSPLKTTKIDTLLGECSRTISR